MEIIYYDPNKPGSYVGVSPLVCHSNTTAASAKNWLSSQDTYTLHKPVRRNFPRRKTYVKDINDLFQADLADMQQLARYNDGYSFLLNCIDDLTKRAFAIPLKNKRGSSVADAFEKLFAEATPTMIETDRGTEFLNSQVQAVFRKHGVTRCEAQLQCE
jgi:transposase InsO family protein